MSEELRACPYCGSGDVRFNRIDDVMCNDCEHQQPFETWQERPIEDELRARVAELEAKLAGVERYRAVALPVRCVCDIYGSSQCRYCEYETWRLDAILSDTRKPLAVEEGVVAVEGKTTHYAVIKAPCDLPAGTEGTVVFMPKEGNDGVD